MNLLQKFALGLSATLFRILLFSAVSLFAFLALYTDSNYILRVLAAEDAFSRFIPALLETNKDQPLASGGAVKVGDPDIKNIITDAFPPSLIQSGSETVVHSMYAWLEGRTTMPDFRIDLASNQKQYAEDLADYAVIRVANLPQCDYTFPTTIDPFTTDCRPEFIDLAYEREQLATEFEQNSGILDETVITADTFTDTSNPNFSKIPAYYDLVRISWLPTLLILTVLALLMVALSRTRKAGMRRVGYSLLSTSFSLLFFTVLFTFILPSFTGSLPIFQTTGAGFDALLNDITIALGQDFAITTIKFCLPLLLVGAIIVIATKPNRADKYKKLSKKSGLANSNEQPKRKSAVKRAKAPVQSSEVSDTKPARSKKQKKYRTIPKKDL